MPIWDWANWFWKFHTMHQWWLCNSETTQPQYMIWLSSETVFQCEFNGDGDYVIWGQHSHNTWYGYHLPFLMWIQWWWWLCNSKTTQPQYMIWLSFETIFWCKFNGDGDYVIWRLHSHNTWYCYHLKPFFDMNSMVMVIM